MQVQLTSDELHCLSELLEARLGELGSEIHHARIPRFKDELKDYRETLTTVRNKLRAALDDAQPRGLAG